jgi:hypothetical protein
MDDDLIAVLIFFNMKSRLLRLLHMGLETIALSLSDLGIKRLARFIDQIMSITNE